MKKNIIILLSVLFLLIFCCGGGVLFYTYQNAKYTVESDYPLVELYTMTGTEVKDLDYCNEVTAEGTDYEERANEWIIKPIDCRFRNERITVLYDSVNDKVTFVVIGLQKNCKNDPSLFTEYDFNQLSGSYPYGVRYDIDTYIVPDDPSESFYSTFQYSYFHDGVLTASCNTGDGRLLLSIESVDNLAETLEISPSQIEESLRYYEYSP